MSDIPAHAFPECKAHQNQSSASSPLDDLIEVFSPPRLCAPAQQLGLVANVSMDLETGWDFTISAHRAAACAEIRKRKPQVLAVSPPCTWFSKMMDVNWKRMDTQKKANGMEIATLLLDFTMLLCRLQLEQGRYFIFEHPYKALSWSRQSVRDVLAHPSVKQSMFDQCQFGLKSKLRCVPMRKRTTLASNLPAVHVRFHNCLCRGGHKHQVIEGWEGGVRRSTWAQKYPSAMCLGLVQCAAAVARK